MTVAEKRLWSELRKLKLHIRRQAPIGRYIADFAHHAARLVIEVDSPWHDGEEAQLRDAERDAWLNSQGYKVLRIRSAAMLDPQATAERIGIEIKGRRSGAKALAPDFPMEAGASPSPPFPTEGKGAPRGSG